MWVFFSIWIGLSLLYFFSYYNRGFDTNVGAIIMAVIVGLIFGGIAATVTTKVFYLWPFDEDVKSDQSKTEETGLQSFSSHEEREYMEKLARKVSSQTDDDEAKEICEKMIILTKHSVADKGAKSDAVNEPEKG